MSLDRFFTAGLILGLATGIVAFSHGSRTPSTSLDLAPQSLPQRHLDSALIEQPTALPNRPSNGLGVGP